MTWNYRVIEDNGQFSIHEVYYNDAGEITSVTENPIAPGGETLEELQEDIGNHSGHWRGPECELQINIKEGVFSAEGRYERQRLGLSLYDAFLESPGFGSPPKTSKYRITYVGTVYGSTAKCTVTRKEESKKASQMLYIVC